MPSTEFGWPVTAHAPVFQVYGTKRKCGYEENYIPREENTAEENIAKRSCQWPTNHTAIMPSSQKTEVMTTEDIHIHDHQNECNTRDNLHTQASWAPQPSHYDISATHHLDHHAAFEQFNGSQVDTQQDSHIMDLSDETCNHPQSEIDFENACSNMDSDFVPNTDQYTSAEFCHAYCGSGEASPRSGRVRCYCKPSWEGMLDIRPYISDVY